MAYSFSRYYIGNKLYSTSNQSYCVVLRLTQTVDSANRKVTVNVRALLGCYRNSAWSSTGITNVLGQSYTLYAKIGDKAEASLGSVGLRTSESMNLSAGCTYTWDCGLDGNDPPNWVSNGMRGWTSYLDTSDTYSYNDNGDAITKSFWVKAYHATYGYSTISGEFTTSSIDPKYSDPEGLDVSVSSKTDTSVTMSVSVTNYGYPPSETGRYLQAAILGSSTYGSPYRYANVSNATSGSLTISNSSSTGSPSLTIAGNTEYYYGALANNTHNEVSIVKGTVVTRPAYITSVSTMDRGHGDITFSVNHAAEGSKYTVQNKYSLDQSTWTNMGDSVTLNFEDTTTVYFKRSSTAGDTTVSSKTVTPHFNRFMYTGVNGVSKKSKKIYIGVNGSSKKVKKIYVGVNGVSKLVYKAT